MSSPAEEHARFMQKCREKLILKAITTDGREFTPDDETESGIKISEYYLYRAINHQKDIELGKVPKTMLNEDIPEWKEGESHVPFDGTSPYIKFPNSETMIDFKIGPDNKLRPKTVKLPKPVKKSWWRRLFGV